MTAARCGLAVTFLFCAATLHADELRWKFTVGDVWNVTHEGATSSTTLVNSKTVKIPLRTRVETQWKIEEVDPNGTATITQQITRLHMHIESAAAGVLDYDSDSQEKPTTPALRDLSAQVQPLIGGKVRLKMSADGKFSEVKADESLAKGGASSAGVVQMLEQPLLPLPSGAVDAGATWKQDRQLPLAFAAGMLQQTYKLDGSADPDKDKTAKISMTGTLDVKPNAGSKVTLKDFEQTGAYVFNVAAGRLVEAETTQKLSTTSAYRDSEIVVRTESRTKVTIK